jgi:hypothetical protein
MQKEDHQAVNISPVAGLHGLVIGGSIIKSPGSRDSR